MYCICQSAVEGVAPGVKFPGDECPVVWGKCGHAFHLQCVSTWLQSQNSTPTCPTCRQVAREEEPTIIIGIMVEELVVAALTKVGEEGFVEVIIWK